VRLVRHRGDKPSVALHTSSAESRQFGDKFRDRVRSSQFRDGAVPRRGRVFAIPPIPRDPAMGPGLRKDPAMGSGLRNSAKMGPGLRILVVHTPVRSIGTGLRPLGILSRRQSRSEPCAKQSWIYDRIVPDRASHRRARSERARNPGGGPYLFVAPVGDGSSTGRPNRTSIQAPIRSRAAGAKVSSMTPYSSMPPVSACWKRWLRPGRICTS
jgi:hypothetical protein